MLLTTPFTPGCKYQVSCESGFLIEVILQSVNRSGRHVCLCVIVILNNSMCLPLICMCHVFMDNSAFLVNRFIIINVSELEISVVVSGLASSELAKGAIAYRFHRLTIRSPAN